MEIKYIQARERLQLLQILELQRQNLPATLSQSEKALDGFVTVQHNLELLEEMNAVCSHILAVDGAQLAGYALCMHPKFAEDIPVLKPMFDQVKGQLPTTAKFIVMGQVCVAKPYRGSGIFRGLYENMQTFLKGKFDMIITEVDISNTRSMNAHHAIGFSPLCTYSSGGQDWEVISLPIPQ